MQRMTGHCTTDICFDTIDENFQKDLELTRTRTDPVLYTSNPGNNNICLQMMTGCTLSNEKCELYLKKQREKFDMDNEQYLPIKFIDQYIRVAAKNSQNWPKTYIEIKRHYCT